jgi:hypothetical protein
MKDNTDLKTCDKFSVIAHSLGSVIAFDFLYHLLINDKIFDAGGKPLPEGELSAAELKPRFAGLYTMGSPIALFMLRNSKPWQTSPSDTPDFSSIRNPIPAGGVWKNFWDDEDVVAYPAERLFAHNPENPPRVLEDVNVSTGWNPVSAHIGYWDSDDVAKGIAGSLRRTP